jgi:hypothetical protein
MDWILWTLIGVVLIVFLWTVLISVVGWFATKFFGKSEAWLDYGLDEDDLL